MANPCIADIENAITNLDFLKADLEDLLTTYTDECDFEEQDRVNDSKCRTVGVAAQLCFNMKVDVAAYPIGPLTSIFFGDDYDCSS
jgi:hypothetical protein